MPTFQVVAILVSAAALFAFINQRYLRVHPTVGIMLQAVLAVVVYGAVARVWPAVAGAGGALRRTVDFHDAVFHWMLGPLLFAGAMHVDLQQLRRHRLWVVVLSLVGTVVSTIAVAGACYSLSLLLHLPVTFGDCAVFGALISPTDPVAVMAFLKHAHAPARLQVIIGGESLFNDGVGVVLFNVLAFSSAAHGFDLPRIGWMFFVQTIGGSGIGLLAGLIVLTMVRRAHSFPVEVLLTLALAMGGYALADALHVSGPIAAVVGGLIIGYHGRGAELSSAARQHLTDFWEFVDESLNAVLFLLVGLLAIDLAMSVSRLVMQLLAVIIVLLARWLSVLVSILLTKLIPGNQGKSPSVWLLTWGGLRGGLAVAMALSLPPGKGHDLILSATYGVVTFSILVQGSSLSALFGREFRIGDFAPADAASITGEVTDLDVNAHTSQQSN